MRFDSLLIEITATPAYLSIFFFALTILFHVLLVWVGSLSEIGWKRIDYIWLGAAAVGLISASGSADRYISEQLVKNLEEPRTISAYNWFRGRIEAASEPDSGVCAERVRSEYSPPEFDQIVQEQKSQCAYFRTMVATIPKEVRAPFPLLVDLGFSDYASTLRFENSYVVEMRRSAEAYEAQRLLYVQRKAASEVSSMEGSLTLLGPLLVCFALALRVTKVSGEVKIAKLKAAQPAVQGGGPATGASAR